MLIVITYFRVNCLHEFAVIKSVDKSKGERTVSILLKKSEF